VIRHAAGPITVATGVARHRGEIGVELRPRAGMEQRTPVFRAENGVNDDQT